MKRKSLVAIAILLLSSMAAFGYIISKDTIKQPSEAIVLRTSAISSALENKDVFDCATYTPSANLVLPPKAEVFKTLSDKRITPDDGKQYLAGTWAPDGKSILFVAPTDDYRNIIEHDQLPSDNSSQLVAISKNQLILYSPLSASWEEITSDGANPIWSQDGRSIYYMTGSNLMEFNTETKSTSYTGQSAPETGAGLTVSRPLPYGILFAPHDKHGSFDLQSIAGPVKLGLTESDEVIFAPLGDQLIVAYGSQVQNGEFFPAVAIIHSAKGETIPLLKNGQFSALEMKWSPSGNQIAYPIRAERSEIRVYDLASNQTRVLLRLNNSDTISGLSWSPDGEYVAFTQGDDISTPRAIWLVSTDGATRQRLTSGGLLPNWSPDGKHILYARPSDNRLLEWFLLEVQPASKKKGGKANG